MFGLCSCSQARPGRGGPQSSGDFDAPESRPNPNKEKEAAPVPRASPMARKKSNSGLPESAVKEDRVGPAGAKFSKAHSTSSINSAGVQARTFPRSSIKRSDTITSETASEVARRRVHFRESGAAGSSGTDDEDGDDGDVEIGEADHAAAEEVPGAKSGSGISDASAGPGAPIKPLTRWSALPDSVPEEGGRPSEAEAALLRRKQQQQQQDDEAKLRAHDDLLARSRAEEAAARAEADAARADAARAEEELSAAQQDAASNRGVAAVAAVAAAAAASAASSGLEAPGAAPQPGAAAAAASPPPPAPKPNIHQKKISFSPGQLTDKYELTDTVLGTGAFGTVKLALLRDDQGEHRRPREDDQEAEDEAPRREFAVKSISKEHKLLKSGEFMQEIEILARLEHPSIIQLCDVYDGDGVVSLVLEYAGGGELFDTLMDEVKLEENRVRYIVAQLADAIAYLHSHGITHRDLKPENILFAAPNADEVKVSDFGFAKHLVSESNMQVTKKRGTMGYAAPEIFGGKGYDEKCDVWSLGIIVYIMLSGIPPFSPMDEFSVSGALEIPFWKHASRMPKVPTSPVEFPEAYWYGISDQAKDWIRQALELDPIHRARSLDLLKHPWLKANVRLNQTTVIPQAVSGRIKNVYSSLR